ncbi:MAG TPA: tetratricopeptide repeat protein [Blastocatellia bacterium]|jgi:tetratricopeptide (TPR) repeat protein|nr:tetratricopeptide repeat protein [Blastocatellia bacterium]
MTTLNLPSNPESAAEPADVIVRRLVRALDYAEGFWLGFARCNLPAQRRKAAAACKELLEPLGIHLIEVELAEPISELLPILKERIESEQNSASEISSPVVERGELRDRRKLAIFISGLEHSIPSSDAYPPILSYLNLNRELFRQELAYPVVIWLPEYALTALARRAPDFWAWRSGLYEFAPEADLANETLDPILREAMYVKSSLSGQAKRERLAMLKGLLANYYELGSGPYERQAQGYILSEMGILYDDIGEWLEAKRAFSEALAIARDQADKDRIAIIVHHLGMLTQNAGDYEEARRLYEESLEINRELGNQNNIAATLHELGRLAQNTGNYEEARRLYEESLEISRKLGGKFGEAITLQQLATIAVYTGDHKEARRLYEESLKIKRQLGNKSGEASTLHGLGLLAQSIGNYEEARQLYEESLKISGDLGNKRAEALCLGQLALLDEEEGKFKEAIEHSRRAEEIFLQLGNQRNITRIEEQIRRLEQEKLYGDVNPILSP